MGILEIVSGPFPFVDLLRIRNLPGTVFFLEHGISNILFVADDIGNRRTIPDFFPFPVGRPDFASKSAI